jgi:predicted O-methyltransferase YrrM
VIGRGTSAGHQAPVYEEIIDDLLVVLGQSGALAVPVTPTPWDAFVSLSDLIHTRFVIPSTTFTPVMRRLVFALGCATHPKHLVGVGTYVAYTFGWLLRDGSNEASGPHLERAVGFDIDPSANALARQNCQWLDHGQRVEFVDTDGRIGIAAVGRPIDLLYIDLDSPDGGKAAYRDVLEAALPHLSPGALILAHDSCVARFQDDIEHYHRLVRESAILVGPWNLAFDACGLSVAACRKGVSVD